MDNLITAFSKMVDASNSLTDKVLSTNIKSNSILDRLITLENQVESLKYANAEVISTPENLVQPDKDLVISISEPVSGTTEISAKDLNVKEFEATDGLVKFIATEDVTIKNLSTSGDLPKTTANAQVQVNASEYVKITQSSIDQTGYNAIEVGLKTVPKSVIIDGVSFNSTLTNNAISIFGTQDGGTITIQNCKFAKCSNPLRLSNNTGGKVTVNIIDCEFNDWDTDPTWAGMIICQDYTSKQADLASLLASVFEGGKMEELQSRLDCCSRSISGIIAGIGTLGKSFAQRFKRRFSPDAIRSIVNMERSSIFKNEDTKCWRKYSEMFSELGEREIDDTLRELLSGYLRNLKG